MDTTEPNQGDTIMSIIASLIYSTFTSIVLGFLIPLSIVQDPDTAWGTTAGQVSVAVITVAVFSWLMKVQNDDRVDDTRVSDLDVVGGN